MIMARRDRSGVVQLVGVDEHLYQPFNLRDFCFKALWDHLLNTRSHRLSADVSQALISSGGLTPSTPERLSA